MKTQYIYNNETEVIEELIVTEATITFGNNHYRILGTTNNNVFIVFGSTQKSTAIMFNNMTMYIKTDNSMHSYPIMPDSYVPNQQLAYHASFHMGYSDTIGPINGFICSKKPLFALEKNDLITHSGSNDWEFGQGICTVEIEKIIRSPGKITIYGQEKNEVIEIVINSGKIVVVTNNDNSYPAIN